MCNSCIFVHCGRLHRVANCVVAGRQKKNYRTPLLLPLMNKANELQTGRLSPFSAFPPTEPTPAPPPEPFVYNKIRTYIYIYILHIKLYKRNRPHGLLPVDYAHFAKEQNNRQTTPGSSAVARRVTTGQWPLRLPTLFLITDPSHLIQVQMEQLLLAFLSDRARDDDQMDREETDPRQIRKRKQRISLESN